MKKRAFALLLAVVMIVGLIPTALAYDGVVRDEEDNISYLPFEQGENSYGGYTIDKVSHPTLGVGEIDGILTGEEQDRGNSYSWSMADGGVDSDYIYIGTCYNSTYYIFQNNVQTSLNTMKKEGKLPADADTNEMAANIVAVMFGVDTFDQTPMSQWNAVIIAVHKKTGEAQVVFCERDIWKDNPDIFPGFPPYMPNMNILSGYRMAFEFKGKIYFAGAGNPTATLIAIDPKTNEAEIAYYNINKTQGVSWGVHGLLVFDNEILMCIATDNYDGNGTPGGQIVASSDPSTGLSSWRVIGDQADFDNLPAVMQTDGLNGGGIWDIIEYNGALYATVVTDKSIDGKINKQGFAMYRGDKQPDGTFIWTQIVGDNETSKYPFGMGINYSMSCNMWVYDGYLYLGTYNDPMLDLAEIPATGDFELLYNDLDHSIYLYRMDANGNFEQVGGKNDNPCFPNGPIGNLGHGLGSASNQYVWRMGVHNDELYIGTYDTSTLTYQFTQITDGQVSNMEYEEISGRADALKKALLEALGQQDNKYLAWFLENTIFSRFTTDLYQKLAGFATQMSADKNPVPEYRQMLEDYENFKALIYGLLNQSLSSPSFFVEYKRLNASEDVALFSDDDAVPYGLLDRLKGEIRAALDEIFAVIDKAVYDKYIHNFVYYFGCNYYAQQCEKGFDLLVSNDGVNFDAITRDGFGDYANHGLRTICSTEYGVYMGTANPYYGTQLWRMYSDRDKPLVPDDPEPLPPTVDEVKAAFAGCIKLTCSTVAGHGKTYTSLLDGSFTVGTVKDGKVDITVNSSAYLADYNTESGTKHSVTGEASKTYTMTYDAEKGQWYSENVAIGFSILCDAEEQPKGPTAEDVINAFKNGNGNIKLNCITNGEEHLVKNYTELMSGSFTIGTVSEGSATVTVHISAYLADYNDTYPGTKHEAAGVVEKTFTVVKTEGGWALAQENLALDFSVKCTTEEPVPTYTVTFDAGNGMLMNAGSFVKTVSADYAEGTFITNVPEAIAPANYQFQCWLCLEDGKAYTPADIVGKVVSGKLTFVAQYMYVIIPVIPVTPVTPPVTEPELNTADHYAYLMGYADGTIHPNGNITRQEVATIFFRLLTEESREAFWSTSNSFYDVSAGHWANNAISTTANAGIINGYPDGSFQGEKTITRAEFATIAANFSDETASVAPFVDAAGHWASAAISKVAAEGWIKGYPDGSFRPDEPITRAEVVTILNAMLERNAVAANMLEDMICWPDNAKSDAWYYDAIQEATNGHTYRIMGGVEVWTSLLPALDWSRLESPNNMYYFPVVK